jgi:hypothetical protein
VIGIPVFEDRLVSSMKIIFSSRMLAWTGRLCIARILAVSIMENLSKSGGWFATAVVEANRKPAVRPVEVA